MNITGKHIKILPKGINKKLKIENFLFTKYRIIYSGKIKMNCSLKLKEIPRIKKDKLYFSFNNKYNDNRTNVV